MPYKLPMIPGFQIFNNEIKMRYPKTPDLDIMNGVHIIRSLHVKKEDDVFDSALGVCTVRKDSKKPSWLVFDKQNLTFDAYFKSTVNESFGRNYNLRKCKIIYFLEDNTIKVVEPVVANSGLPQGCLIKRHKIPLPNDNNSHYYQLLDLNVGVTVEFYGKRFKIIGVDNFTRDFLKKAGIDVPENLSMPVDPYFVNREENMNKKLPKIKATPSDGHRKMNYGFDGILNFKGYWDDRHNTDGSLHTLEIRYFLVDDTIQIVELDPDDGLKTFLKREKIPKDRVYVRPPGSAEQNDLLNVLGVNPASRWYTFDPLTRSDDVRDSCYYHWSDLYVGAEIDVYSRKIILSNCDEFTKQYYLDYGLQDDLPSIDRTAPSPRTAAEVGEISNDVPVCRDNNMSDKLFDDNAKIQSLVFKAKIAHNESDRSNREFVVKCFLSDQSFSVSETKVQTAGSLGCRFFSRRKIPKRFPNEPNVIFQLYVGIELTIDNFQFVFVDVEDKTLRFMMDHPKEFPHSDVNYAMNRVLEILGSDVETFSARHFQNRDVIERNAFIETMSNQFPELNRHGVFVLALQYKKHETHREVSDHVFRSVLQDELRRELFVGFDGLEINFRQRNLDNKDGYLERGSAFKALKSARLPFSTEIIDMLLNRFTHPETKKVDYMDLLKYINYTVDPTPGSEVLAKDMLFLHRKSDEVFIKVREFINDLRKLS